LPWDRGLGYTFSLEKFRDIDGLYVKVSVRYIVPKEALHTWTMSHCSKNVNCTIAYPKGYEIQIDNLGVEQEIVDKTSFEHMYSFKYTFWLMPMTGIAFHFVNRGTAPTAQVPVVVPNTSA
jgi:hypothetical protein